MLAAESVVSEHMLNYGSVKDAHPAKGQSGEASQEKSGESAPSIFICLFLLKLILMSDFAYTFKLCNIFQRDRLNFQVQQQIMASGMPANTEQIHKKQVKYLCKQPDGNETSNDPLTTWNLFNTIYISGHYLVIKITLHYGYLYHTYSSVHKKPRY